MQGQQGLVQGQQGLMHEWIYLLEQFGRVGVLLHQEGLGTRHLWDGNV